MTFPKAYYDLKELVEEYQKLYNRLLIARQHIRRNIRYFTPEELESMYLNGIIELKDIPEDLMTDFVKQVYEKQLVQKR
jgi:hypothetical protein